MAWIESHQALGHHPKTLHLAAELKCSVPAAVGYLHLLWWWALDYAPGGVVEHGARGVAARACYFRGKPDVFWSALMSAGFVDQTGDNGAVKIHDWMDYAGRLVDKRAANAQRMRDARATHATRTSGARAGATNKPDQPDTNQPTNRITPNPTADAAGLGGDTPPPQVGNPRANGTNPRAMGTNPRARRSIFSGDDNGPRYEQRVGADGKREWVAVDA